MPYWKHFFPSNLFSGGLGYGPQLVLSYKEVASHQQLQMYSTEHLIREQGDKLLSTCNIKQ